MSSKTDWTRNLLLRQLWSLIAKRAKDEDWVIFFSKWAILPVYSQSNGAELVRMRSASQTVSGFCLILLSSWRAS